MAKGKKIEYSDIADKSGIKALETDILALKKAMVSLRKEISSVSKLMAKNPLKSGDDLKKHNNEVTHATEVTKDLLRIQKQSITTQAKLSTARTDEAQKLRESKVELQNYNKEQTTAAKKTLATTTSMNKMSLELVENRAKYRNLTEAQRANRSEGGKLLKTIQKQDASLKKLDNSLGQNQRSVGKYTNAVKGMGAQFLGATAIIYGFFRVLKDAFSTITQFGQAQATLAATLGKTREEIDQLTKSSISYGKATKFTATEVSSLQNELAKLGFTMGEIQVMTGSVLDFAEATGGDLSSAAKATGIALKAFGLSALDAKEVTASLAIATTKSALSFSDYETILSTLGPVANAYGFSLQEVLAFQGKLKDSGFDASSSATAFRNILLNLADTGGDLAKELGGAVTSFDDLVPALIRLRDKGVDLNTTLQLTDKRSVAAFNSLLAGAKDVTELKDALVDVNAEFDKMIGTKTDNTVDAMARTGSAWDGVVLSFKNSEGFFTAFFDSLATTMNTFTDDFTSTSDKMRILLGFGQMQEDAQKAMEWRQRVLDSVADANREQLAIIESQYGAEAEAGEAFSIEIIARVHRQIAAIEEAELAALERKTAQEAATEATRIAAQEKQEAADQVLHDKRIERLKKEREEIIKNQAVQLKSIEIAEVGAVKETQIYNMSSEEQAAKTDELNNLSKDRIANDNLVTENAINSTEVRQATDADYYNFVGDGLSVISALASDNADAQKDIAIAQAIISTIQSAVSSYQSLSGIPVVGPALGAAAAAAAVASGYARVQQIRNTDIPSYFEGTEYLNLNGNPDGRDTVPVMANKGERIVPTAINNMLAGVSNPELPALVNLGKAMRDYGINKMVEQQKRTNGLLKGLKYIDDRGNLVDLEGNTRGLA